MTKLKIEYWDVDKLKAYAKNPRRNEAGVESVAASIKEYGFLVPIVASDDGTVLAGHTRLAAAKRLGIKSVPVVLASHLTERQARAFRIADNKVAELSDWDYGLLSDELRALLDEDVMPVLGFTDSEIASILGMDSEAFDSPVNKDSLRRPKPPTVRHGEVWRLGRHLLYCGYLPPKLSASCCIIEHGHWESAILELCQNACTFCVFQDGASVSIPPPPLTPFQMAVGVRSMDTDGEPLRVKHDSVLICHAGTPRRVKTDLTSVWDQFGTKCNRRRGAMLMCMLAAGVGENDTVLAVCSQRGEAMLAAEEAGATVVGFEPTAKAAQSAMVRWTSAGEDVEPPVLVQSSE
jgi:hypothetical protein